MKSLELLFLLALIFCSTLAYNGDDLRRDTDKYIFGTDPAKRTIKQAATRDFVHGVYHTYSAVKNYKNKNQKEFKNDVKRAVDHFTGENVKQTNTYKNFISRIRKK